ncbi:ABC transporter transmembrane domain-containing protein [Notoacmeibacter ruber]|uniref:ATP-binding cassette domain-containing protein n=1 Tax=Notoacmeibacter ruber TaxID=2670375 RepID=A0A3L7JD67_9HYPH|nr:ABC transporter transmembrane domain-containing protein [Notoacmeibacter ruber]RLQ88697.1 ATP-binding cassette domain-containing protein [Notoacmeibacter ruber]
MARRTTAERKQRRNLAPLLALWPYVKRYPGKVAGAFFFLFLAAATTLALPVAVRRMIDNGFNEASSGLIGAYFGMLIVMAGLLAVASSGRYYFVITLGERVVADLREAVFSHVTRLSPAFFDMNQSGEIVSRLTADTTQIKSAVGATTSVALRNGLLVIGAIAMMVFTSPKLSAMVLAAIPVIVLTLVGFGRSVRRRSRAAQDTLADASAFAAEQIGAIRTLQAYNGEPAVRRYFGGAVESAFQAARSSIKARALLTFVAIFVIFTSIVAVLWFGARDVINGEMSPGTLSQFLLYSVFAAGALGSLSEVWGELSQAAGAAERLIELLDEKPGIAAPGEPARLPSSIRGRIGFNDVSFSYPSRPDLPALHGLTFTVEPGETVAIVGPSGAGKSTILGLLLRYYDPQSGQVTLDGVPVETLDPTDLRNALAVVQQDPTIFATTVAENIRFGRPQADDQAVAEAATAANAQGFIEAMPEGFQTKLGERGITLSGGQRQRLAIARAILRDAPVLLLDEATSALDAESENAVQSALEMLLKGRTTIVIAHRLATILKADRILVMDEGRVVEQGTHSALVAKGGLYSRLAALQFDTEQAP